MSNQRLRELIRLGVPNPFPHPEGGKGGGTPPAPDYRGAAVEQSAASKEMATQQNFANRPTMNTPWGQQTWSTAAGTDPSTGQPITNWTSNINLTQAEQDALDSQQSIQSGRSAAAEQLLGQATSATENPFNWGAMPERAGAPAMRQTGATGTTRDVSPTGQQTSVAQTGQQTYVPTTGQQTDLQQYGLDTHAPQQTTFSTNEPAFAAERQRIEGTLFDKMRPEHERQQQATQTRLANMGLTAGSEAYNRELERLQGTQAGERFNAFQTAGQEQQRMQGMLMGQQQQAFGQDQSSQQARNAALMQQFGQGQAAGQFRNQALENQFGQNLQAGQFQNQALQNQFGQGLSAGQFANTALQNQFGQNMQAADFYNQSGNQQFNQNLAANNQNFQQQLAGAQFQNQNRQAAIAEEAQRRGMPLSELNALLTGQQVNMPNMPSFAPAGKGEAPQLLQAAQNQGNFGIQAANAGGGGGADTGAMIGGVASIAAAFV